MFRTSYFSSMMTHWFSFKVECSLKWGVAMMTYTALVHSLLSSLSALYTLSPSLTRTKAAIRKAKFIRPNKLRCRRKFSFIRLGNPAIGGSWEWHWLVASSGELLYHYSLTLSVPHFFWLWQNESTKAFSAILVQATLLLFFGIPNVEKLKMVG